MTEAYYGTETAEPSAAPARQDSRDATWGDHPDYDETNLSAEYDGDLEALTAEDQLPTRQDSRAATWGDNPGYYDETDLGTEYDGDLDTLTAEDHTPEASEDHALDSGTGDQDQAAIGESLSATGKPDDRPAEVTGITAAAAPEHEDGNVTAPESSPAGAAADTGSVAEADARERPDEAPQAGQAARPGDGHADRDAAPDAGLKELKAEYEASLKELKAELQALKDSRQAALDAPGITGREADQPFRGDLPVSQQNPKEVKPEGDRPGLWSNAKTALYGAVGTTVTLAAADQFVPGAPHPVVDIATGAVTVIAALVPAMREGWKRKHDDSPDKP